MTRLAKNILGKAQTFPVLMGISIHRSRAPVNELREVVIAPGEPKTPLRKPTANGLKTEIFGIFYRTAVNFQESLCY